MELLLLLIPYIIFAFFIWCALNSGIDEEEKNHNYKSTEYDRHLVTLVSVFWIFAFLLLILQGIAYLLYEIFYSFVYVIKHNFIKEKKEEKTIVVKDTVVDELENKYNNC